MSRLKLAQGSTEAKTAMRSFVDLAMDLEEYDLEELLKRAWADGYVEGRLSGAKSQRGEN